MLGIGGEVDHHRARAGPLERLARHVAERLRGSEGRDHGTLAAQRARQERGLERGNAARHQEGHAGAVERVPVAGHLVVAEVTRRRGRKSEFLGVHGSPIVSESTDILRYS